MPSKYIVFETKEGERAVIFPRDNFYHDDLSSCFSELEPVSAGFVSIEAGGVITCFGRSEALDLPSRGEDDEIVIRHQLRSRP